MTRPYIDTLIELTTIQKSKNEANYSDLADNKIFSWLKPQLNYAALRGKNSFTFDIRDLAQILAKIDELQLLSTDYEEIYNLLDHAIAQISEQSEKYDLYLGYFENWHYYISWPDEVNL